MKYKDELVSQLHLDEANLISEAEALKFCSQTNMCNFASIFKFKTGNLSSSYEDPFRLELKYNMLSFVDQLRTDKLELLEIINSTGAYEIIGIQVQLLRLEDLLKCVKMLIDSTQISSNKQFEFMCRYYDYAHMIEEEEIGE